MKSTRFLFSLLFILWIFFNAPCQAETLIIQVGKLIPVEGPEQKDVWIWIENGIIKKIGKDFEIPWNATIIDAHDKILFPGTIEVASSGSMDQPNENVPMVPFVSVRESINPTASYFEDLIRNGITTVQIVPGTETIIGGYGAVLKPTGNTLESMLRKEPGMLRIAMGADSRHSRIRKMATLRQTFQETLLYRENLQSKETPDAPSGLTPQLYLESAEPVKQPLIDLIEGRLTALIHCPEPGDCFRALELAKTFQFKPVLQVGPRAFLVADLLKQAGVSIILDSEITLQEDIKGQGDLETIILPKIYQEKGVPYCLSSRGRRYLWYQAGLALQAGLPREEALKSITLYPAQILGLEKQIGSLTEGKSADFLVLSGDPLDIRTWIEEVWIEGKKVYSRKDDLRLKHFSGASDK